MMNYLWKKKNLLKKLRTLHFQVGGTAIMLKSSVQGWKFMSCRHCQELCHRASWLLIHNCLHQSTQQIRSQVRKLIQLLTMTTTHKLPFLVQALSPLHFSLLRLNEWRQRPTGPGTYVWKQKRRNRKNSTQKKGLGVKKGD